MFIYLIYTEGNAFVGPMLCTYVLQCWWNQEPYDAEFWNEVNFIFMLEESHCGWKNRIHHFMENNIGWFQTWRKPLQPEDIKLVSRWRIIEGISKAVSKTARSWTIHMEWPCDVQSNFAALRTVLHCGNRMKTMLRINLPKCCATTLHFWMSCHHSKVTAFTPNV